MMKVQQQIVYYSVPLCYLFTLFEFTYGCYNVFLIQPCRHREYILILRMSSK